MTAMNVVRFRVKAGNEGEFIDAHRRAEASFQAKGFLGGSLVRTGDQTFCMIGTWRSFDDLAAARPHMIAVLDSFRHTLEDLGAGLGLTDPVSGEVVVNLPAPKAAKKPPARRPAKRAPAKKRAAKKRKR